MKFFLIFVCLFVLVFSGLSTKTPNNGQVYVLWTIEDNCSTEYLHVTANENKRNFEEDSDFSYYLYYSRLHIDNCTRDWFNEYILLKDTFDGLTIDANGKMANLDVSAFKDNAGHNITIKLFWTLINSDNSFHDQTLQNYGIMSTNVYGFIAIDDNIYHTNNARGYIYNGKKNEMYYD